MPASQLPNYIRTHRKRIHLTQDEVAFLLGTKSSAIICRHERCQQKPNLETLLAYEILFRTPVRSLFGGVHQKVELKLRRRVCLLLRKLAKAGQDRMTGLKIKVLTVFLEELPSTGHAYPT